MNDCFTALGWTPEGEGEDQKLLREGLLRKSDTKWGGRARK